MSSLERIQCQWCQTQNPLDAKSCSACGAPLDVRSVVSDSGWFAAPRIRDLTEIQFGNSRCQVEGTIVPVVDLDLGAEDQVYFEHNVMLWKDPNVPLENMSLQGASKRMLAGMPVITTIARGPGRIAFSRDAAGELVVLPMQPGVELDVREHAFLLASMSLDYSYTRIQGLRNIFFGGQGMFMDRFVSSGTHGLLILHGCGNVFQRNLDRGESILVEPGGFLYKDASVTMEVETLQLGGGMFGALLGGGVHMVRMTGPGRLGIQSMTHHLLSGE